MEKKILKAIEEGYRKGLRDAKGLNDIRPYLLTSQAVAQELANKFCQTLIVEHSEQLCDQVCDWYRVGHQLNGHKECRTCGKQKAF